MENIYEEAKVVIIDDVEQVLNSTKNRLEFEGMNVKCFSNPIEGLEYLKNNKDEVLLLDFFMPQMNGDEFVEELRKYNQETIIILQTGYSDRIPPLEMIDKMNIQGYLDKLKGEDELVLMTKAAIKTASLNKQIRKKDKEIESLTFKKSVIGELITHLVNESKNELFQISGMNESIMKDTDNYLEENNIIKSATEKIYDLYESLNFENEKSITTSQLESIMKQLLKAKLLFNNVTMTFECNTTNIIEEKVSELIYMLIKIVDLMINNQSKNISIRINKNNNITIINVVSDVNCNNIETEEIYLLKQNETTNIIKNENSIVIEL